MKLGTKLKIPLRNAEMVHDGGEDGDPQMGCFPKGSGVKRKRCIKVKPKDQRFKIVNSCSGFLCLSKPTRNNPVAVCNPVTGEYINLPVANRGDENMDGFVDCGFGFSPRTNQYKVRRMFDQWTRDHRFANREGYYGRGAEIHTLGTESWRSIDNTPQSRYKLAFPTYLDGGLHWLCLDKGCCLYSSGSEVIVTFDLDSERFQSVLQLPHEYHSEGSSDKGTRKVSMGVLGGCLCICDASGYSPIDIWVMKKYGVQESWTNLFSIDTICDERWPYGLYQPINFIKNGTVLIFHYFKSALIHYDDRRLRFRYLKVRGAKSRFEAIAHIPSFLSLKDAVVGDKAVVMNVNTRYG
ncbi:F-box protein At3g07870-like [Cornus florida]|uniref:F-box protein At3g07870-like n=1 Tax=Cornus florida TaxID=4283 RepID=UPI00289F82D2|nr:F-box protein At3g07870-like [Cornus florida]